MPSLNLLSYPGSSLATEKMYLMYVEKITENSEEPMTSLAFRKVFMCFNVHSGHQTLGIRNVFVRLQILLTNCADNEKTKAEQGKDLQFGRAESAREQMKADKEDSSTHCSSIERQ
jgi:hydroxypyruvate isomerase